MKKSKIIVPALAVLLLSTAASVTGTVAWFTANKVFTMKAGQFAVVNTKNNLEAIVEEGVGTDLSGNDIVVEETATPSVYKALTDASFNHNNANPYFVEPDNDGARIDSKYNLLGNPSLESNLEREAGKIYSAFTWTITFKMSFSAASTKKVGLFLDLGSANTWAHEVVKFDASYVIKDTEEGHYYSNPDLTGTDFEVHEGDTVGAVGKISAGTWYKAAPDDTGKGFRMAFVPSAVPSGSMGYAKVWAPHQSSGNAKYINDVEPDEYSNSETYEVGNIVYREITAVKHYYKCKTAVASAEAFDAAKWDEIDELKAKEVAYVKTSSFSNGTRTADVTSALPVMVHGDATREPNPAIDAATNLTSKTNFLGYFAPGAGSTVEMTYTVVAWYEGTDPEIVNTASTIYETMTTSLEFVASTLAD